MLHFQTLTMTSLWHYWSFTWYWNCFSLEQRLLKRFPSSQRKTWNKVNTPAAAPCQLHVCDGSAFISVLMPLLIRIYGCLQCQTQQIHFILPYIKIYLYILYRHICEFLYLYTYFTVLLSQVHLQGFITTVSSIYIYIYMYKYIYIPHQRYRMNAYRRAYIIAPTELYLSCTYTHLKRSRLFTQ